MKEIIARISERGTIELVDEEMLRLVGTQPITPEAAAFLARSLLACAAVLAFDKTAKEGSLISEAHLPILKWAITTRTGTQTPVIIFSIPPGIDLTFQTSTQVERELGVTLVAHAEGDQHPELPPDRLQ
jgi:hypothetical protein